MNTHRSRAGFTFWEILAVVAIVLVTAAVLFPVFQKVRGGGPYSSCQYNMRLLGLVFIQYTQDADEKFPPGVNAAGNGWAGQTYPFSKTDRLYRCPQDELRYDSHTFVSYAENQNLVKKSEADLTNAAATVELYEFTTPGCLPSAHETVSATGLSARPDSKRHDQPQAPFGLNFLAVDGHVKRLTPSQVSGGPGAVRPDKKRPFVLTFAVK